MSAQFSLSKLLRSSISSTVRSVRGISILTTGFPETSTKHSDIRSFSSRSIRGRSNYGGRKQASSHDVDYRRRESQSGGLGGRSVQPKSLIEDEAELSDWVSDLKMDSFRLSASSESDVSDSNEPRFRDERKGSAPPLRSQSGTREDFRPHRKGRDDDSKNFYSRRDSENSKGKVSRNSAASASNSLRNRHFDSESEDGFRRYRSEEKFSSPIKRGDRGSGPSNYHGRGKGDFGRQRSNPGRKTLVTSEDDEETDISDSESEDDFRRCRSEEKFSNPIKRGDRSSGPSNYHGRGNGNFGRQSNPGRKPLVISEDDEETDVSDSEDDSDNDIDLGDYTSGETSEEEGENDSDESSESRPSVFSDETGAHPDKSSRGDSYLSHTRFNQCSISPLSLKGLESAGYERMTVVQEATLPIILRGKDVLAKAKTGTGKTVAFLLPAIEVIVKLPPPDRDQRKPFNVLVICPTRELANQAATEASTLLKYHPSIGVQVVMGGTRLALEQKRMQANPCQILVATPGRLKDHIENTPGFATRLMGVKVLVLDEADHLLDMGFRKDIEKIIAAVPKQRQTLLFSATVPEEVRQICHIALKRDHEFINTVEEGSEETHSQVRQRHLVAPLDNHFSLLYGILKEHISEDIDYKVLVFCTTAMVTKLIAELLSELKLNVREIHSRKPQSYRTRVSDEFRKSKGLILVTSDVSARGVDYPDVTLVIQIGVPADREQYIHRLGRTGRKGKEGEGILLLAPWEEFFLSSINNLPITKALPPTIDPETKKKVERALSNIEGKNKASAYQAWLGYYNSNRHIGRDKCRLVELANEFSRSMGMDNPPAIPKLVLGKMGLKNIPGLRIK